MSSEKKPHGGFNFEPIRTGAFGLLLLLGLLLFFAFLISRGYIPETSNNWLISAAALIAGFVARKTMDDGREEGILRKALMSAVFMMLPLVFLSACFKDTHLHIRPIAAAAGMYTAGDVLGSVVRINKKGRRKHVQKRKYNR